MRVDRRFMMMCAASMGLATYASRYVNASRKVAAEPKKDIPLASFDGISTQDPVLQRATHMMIHDLQEYARTNHTLSDVQTADATGCRAWVPEGSTIEVIMPFSGKKSDATHYYQLVARAKFLKETGNLKLRSLAIYNAAATGQRLGLADPVLTF